MVWLEGAASATLNPSLRQFRPSDREAANRNGDVPKHSNLATVSSTINPIPEEGREGQGWLSERPQSYSEHGQNSGPLQVNNQQPSSGE